MLAKLSQLASDEMQIFFESHGVGNTELIVDVAHALVTKYGEASAAAACNLYDEIAEKQGKAVRSAETAETASREKTAGAVYGSLKDSPEGRKLKQIPDRLVKQAAADTMLQNAKRDGAEWAWIPSGDGCAMCMTIASRGWLPASSAQLSGGHASHIHANCKCQFAIRFDKNLNVEGYDPDELKRQYDAAEGSGSRQKINYLRRKQYEKKNNDGSQTDSGENKEKERGLSNELSFVYNGKKSFIPKNNVITDTTVIAGNCSNNKLRIFGKLAEKYGGVPKNWQKRAGKVTSEKFIFDVHWYENGDGKQYDEKIKFINERK